MSKKSAFTTPTFWRFRCAVLIMVTADIVRSSAIECGRAPKSFMAMAYEVWMSYVRARILTDRDTPPGSLHARSLRTPSTTEAESGQL